MIPSSKYYLVGKALIELFTIELPNEMKNPDVLGCLVQTYDILSSVISFPHYMVEKTHTEAREFFDQAAEHFKWNKTQLHQRKLKCLRELYATGMLSC